MEKTLKKLIEHFDEQLTRARGFEADKDSQYWQGNADALEGVIADMEEIIREQKKK